MATKDKDELDKLYKEVASDDVVPIFRVKVDVYLQYVNSKTDKLIMDNPLITGVQSYGYTVGQALGVVNAYVNEAIRTSAPDLNQDNDDTPYSVEWDGLEDDQTLIDEDFDEVQEEPLEFPDVEWVNQTYQSYIDSGEEELGLIEVEDQQDKVVDLVDYFNRSKGSIR